MSTLAGQIPEGLLERIASIPTGAGEARWWFGSLATIKLDGRQTGGRFSLTEVHYPSGLEVPLHVHHHEDEVFYVLEGKIAYTIGNRRFEALPGQTIFAPKDVPHGFVGTSVEPVRYLILYAPAGYEDFIRDSSQPAQSLTLPPPADGPPDPALVAQIDELMVTKYACEWWKP
jgi:mannose-6-phosphate isomerase-like protein (cupin superfamily)